MQSEQEAMQSQQEAMQSEQEEIRSEQEAQREELLGMMSNLNSSTKASPPTSACKWWHSDSLRMHLATYITKACLIHARPPMG